MAEENKGHLVFATGSSLYALPADRVSEVVSLPLLTRVPGAPGHLLGVFAHRGEVVPVVDVAALAGRAAESTYRRAVLIRGNKGAVAFTATRVAGVSHVTGSMEALGVSGFQAHMRGPAKASMGDVAVIDPDGLIEFLSAWG